MLEHADLPKALAIHCRVSGLVNVRTGDLSGGRAQLERAVSDESGKRYMFRIARSAW